MERIPVGSPAPSVSPAAAAAAFGRLVRFLADRKKILVWLAGITLLSIALDLTLPLLVEGCVDALGLFGFADRDIHSFFLYLRLFFANVVLSAVLGYLHDVLSARVTLHLTNTLRSSLFAKILRLGAAKTERLLPGDMMSRIMNDADLAARAVSETLLTLFSSLIVIIGCAALMLYRSPLLGGLSILASLLSVAATGIFSGILMPRLMKRQMALGRMNAHADETIRGYRTCLTGGRSGENIRRMQQLSRTYYKAGIRAARVESMLEPLMMLFGNMNFILIILFGSRQVISGAISIGTLQAFVLLSRQFMEPVQELGGCMAQVQSALACSGRIFSILDMPDEEKTAKISGGAGAQVNSPDGTAPAEQNSPQESAASDIQGSIQKSAPPDVIFDGVSFAYRRSYPVLSDIHFTVRKGEKLAIAGETGAGKTTLAKLLTGLYTDYEGRICLKGAEIRSLGLEALRRQIVMIPQDPQLVDGTILENIAYGMPDVSEEEVIRAARGIGLDPAISLLPEGYHTHISATRNTLSQGQLQMICLARVLLRDEGLVILDEAASSVDAATQKQMKKALDRVLPGRTCIMIAHNLASVQDADRILVLAEGRIAEEGTHAQLMEADGLYAAAFRRQYRTA